MNVEKFEEEHPEYAEYVKEKLQGAVQLICELIVRQYDNQLASQNNQIEKLKSECKDLEVLLWNANAD